MLFRSGHVRTYAANRTILLEALQQAGLTTRAPADGAFYLYTDVSAFGLSSADLAGKLLEETGVAATPGDDFDPVDGNHWLRLSYAGSSDDMRKAAAHMVAWFGAMKRR